MINFRQIQVTTIRHLKYNLNNDTNSFINIPFYSVWGFSQVVFACIMYVATPYSLTRRVIFNLNNVCQS